MAKYWIYAKRKGDPVQGLRNNGFPVNSLDKAKVIAKNEATDALRGRSDVLVIYREVKTVYPEDLRSDRVRAEFGKYLKSHGYLYMDLAILAPVGEVWWDGAYFSYKSNRTSYIDDKRISRRL